MKKIYLYSLTLLIFFTVPLFCTVSCFDLNNQKRYSASENLTETIILSHNEASDQVIDDQWLIPEVTLIDPNEPQQIIKNTSTALSYQASHPRDQWVIISYHPLGGAVTDNIAVYSEKLNGILKLQHTFNADLTLLNLTIRNHTKCIKAGFTEEKCLGKHSMRPFSEELEIYFIVTVNAIDPSKASSDDDVDNSLLYGDLLGIAQVVCEGYELDNYIVSITPTQRLGKAMAMSGEGIQTTLNNKDWIEGLLYLSATIELGTKTEDRHTDELRKQIKQKHKNCLDRIQRVLTE